MIRLRFGFKLSWPFSNAGIFVRYTTAEGAGKILDAANTLKLTLAQFGLGDLVGRIVCEES